MKKVYNVLAVMMLAAIMSSCSQKNNDTFIVVANESDLPRENETVEILFKALQDINEGLTAENVVILDAEGKQVPSQVYTEADSTTVKLVFQASVKAGETVEYKVQKGVREDYPVKAYSRHVPERKDDYAYENNKVAGRIYGPALNGPNDPRTFGSDIWLKSTERMVIDERYYNELEKGISYHHDYGEGMDCYKVGNTLGGGALVPHVLEQKEIAGENFVPQKEKLVYDVVGSVITGNNWATCKHVCNGPVRTKAVFTYEPFNVGNVKYSAVRELELDANTHFVKWVTTFIPEEHKADSMMVLLAAIKHDVIAEHVDKEWVAFTEKASDPQDNVEPGNISVAVVYDPISFADNKIAYAGTSPDGHAGVVTKEAVNKPITVWTGSGWSKAGIDSPEKWTEMVKNFAYAQKHPLNVTIKK